MTYCDLSAVGPRISRCYSFQLQSTKIHLTKMTTIQRCMNQVKMDYSVMKPETLNQVLITNPNMTIVLLMLTFTDMIYPFVMNKA